MNLDLSDYNPQPRTEMAGTLPSRWYTDPSFLEAEKDKIFHKTWQLVGRTDQIPNPGDFFAYDLVGEPIVVLRDAQGKIRALSNVCRHRASLIASGQGNCKALRCPYHGWTYGLDGQLLGAREFEGVHDWERELVKLPQFKVETVGPLILVNLDKNAMPIGDYLGKIPAEIDAHGLSLSRYHFAIRKDYVIDCNWKVYIDNYQEGYHIPLAHPKLFKELEYAEYRVDCFENHSYHHAPIRRFSPNDPRVADRRYATSEDESKTLYYWIFPNLMINIYPDNMSTNLILPLGPDKTLTVFEWFYTPENLAKGSAWLEESASFSDQVQHEDIAICESVQRGLKSKTYDIGRFSPKRENGVHFFHQQLHKWMSAP